MSSYKDTYINSIFLQSLNPLNLHTNLAPFQPSDLHHHTDSRTPIAKEETKIQKEIIEAITTGKLETLKPNSGEAVPIGEHYICVSFYEETESDYRVWEWHGHVVCYNEENGYTQEYVYGNYFERMMRRLVVDERDDDDYSEREGRERSLGLGELIGGLSLRNDGILGRNMNASFDRIWYFGRS
ncbi:hypothetical protein L1049_013008 [Liquidambar formosana]|uniref:Uncharacterized protein n=1 Tax=Liquidambar formosana TaxID=63359 RepID=A0AAP0RJP9_LIQFO